MHAAINSEVCFDIFRRIHLTTLDNVKRNIMNISKLYFTSAKSVLTFDMFTKQIISKLIAKYCLGNKITLSIEFIKYEEKRKTRVPPSKFIFGIE